MLAADIHDTVPGLTRAVVSVLSVGNGVATDIIAAQGAGKIIQVHSALIVPNAAAAMQFRSGTTTVIAASFDLAPSAPFTLDFAEIPMLVTAANETLRHVNWSGAVRSFTGWIDYTVVDG